MSDMNKCIFSGRLTRDVELRYTSGGKAVASFSIANGETWKDKESGEKKEKTSFLNFTSWGKQGEIIAQYFAKGDEIHVVAKAVQSTWVDEATEAKRSKVDFTVQEFFWGRKSRANEGSQGGEVPAEDIPF